MSARAWRLVLVAALAFALAAPLSACGKKGDLEEPEGLSRLDIVVRLLVVEGDLVEVDLDSLRLPDGIDGGREIPKGQVIEVEALGAGGCHGTLLTPVTEEKDAKAGLLESPRQGVCPLVVEAVVVGAEPVGQEHWLSARAGTGRQEVERAAPTVVGVVPEAGERAVLWSQPPEGGVEGEAKSLLCQPSGRSVAKGVAEGLGKQRFGASFHREQALQAPPRREAPGKGGGGQVAQRDVQLLDLKEHIPIPLRPSLRNFRERRYQRSTTSTDPATGATCSTSRVKSLVMSTVAFLPRVKIDAKYIGNFFAFCLGKTEVEP